MDVQQVRVTFTTFGSPPTAGTATVLDQSPGQRAARTVGHLGVFWGLALIALFIPVIHLVLVPTLLVAGVAVGIVRAREARRLLAVRGTCPFCKREQQFEAGGRFTAERGLDCPTCHHHLTLTSDAAAVRG